MSSLFIVIPLLVTIAACSGRLTLDGNAGGASLRNARFSLESLGADTISLREGLFDDRSRHVRAALSEKMWLGDLNGDGREDAAGLIAVNCGESGNFEELVVWLNGGSGSPVISSRLLGDCVIVKSGRIDSGVIRLEMIVHGINEPLCCPTLRATESFVMEGGVIHSADWPKRISCSGTEPFWTLNILDDSLHFIAPDRWEAWKEDRTIIEGPRMTVYAADADGNRVAVVLESGRCSDGMSERVYPMRATLYLGSRRLTGCADEWK